MRFLGIGDYLGLGDLYLSLQQAGHEVRVFVGDEVAQGIFAGMLTRVDDWRAQLPWIRAAGSEGIILFESATRGSLQDELRQDGYQVIGGSAWGDRIEIDRAFGQQVMLEAGMQIARTHAFSDYFTALAFLRGQPGRYVYKRSDREASSTENYVGVLAGGQDMVAYLQMEQRRRPAGAQFVLMEHVGGVEAGVGAFFNGETFLQPAVLDWEHKRFFNGDLGELTGEMGTIVTYRGADAIFDATLGRLVEPLRQSGYCGYINLNTIVNEQGIWPLEFTSRFGYPGFAICDALHIESWDVIFRRMLDRSSVRFATHEGFAAGVVLTVPPFPYEYGYEKLSKGNPVFLDQSLTKADLRHLHFGEVALQDGQLVTAGYVGYVLVATGRGMQVADAQRDAYSRIRKVVTPNGRYRTDIGDRLIAGDLARMQALGLF